MAMTVSKLTAHLVQLFEADNLLRDVEVVGEVSNWKRASSGHSYFRLKDSGAAINAVMWKSSAGMQRWLPREGDQVVAHGYVGVYPENGAYQLYVNRLQPAGRGQLYVQLEALKEKLRLAGLFEAGRKRPLPATPACVGIVTSPDGAALRDLLRTLATRWPLVEVVLFPTLVQGPEAASGIVAALAAAHRHSSGGKPIDTLILARGGGSIEDLWPFNDEQVALAVAQSPIPVVSGVGHETDFTVVDFVADLRAPTPTAAAEAAVRGCVARQELLGTRLLQQQQRIRQRVEQERRGLVRLSVRLQRLHPQRRLDQLRQLLDERERRLHWVARQTLVQRGEQRLAALQRLDALNPLRVLGRGYSIVQNAGGGVVTGPAEVAAGEKLTVQSAGGSYGVAVLQPAAALPAALGILEREQE